MEAILQQHYARMGTGAGTMTTDHTPLTDQEIQRLLRKHGSSWCSACDEPAPCSGVRALTELATLRQQHAAVLAEIEEWREARNHVGESYSECMRQYGKALETVRAAVAAMDDARCWDNMRWFHVGQVVSAASKRLSPRWDYEPWQTQLHTAIAALVALGEVSP